MTTPNWIYLERISHLKQQLAHAKPDRPRAENPLALPAKPAPSLWQFDVASVFREHQPIDRAELYEDVWTTPLTSLTERYGYSDAGLRKVCLALEVPLPGVGHWAKVAAGQSISRPPLPEQLGDERRFFRDPRLLQINSDETRAADMEWLAEKQRFEHELASRVTAQIQMPPQLAKLEASIQKATRKAEAKLEELRAADAKRPKSRARVGAWEPSHDSWQWNAAAGTLFDLSSFDKDVPRVSVTGGAAAVELLSAFISGVLRRDGVVSPGEKLPAMRLELAGERFTVNIKEVFEETKLRRELTSVDYTTRTGTGIFVFVVEGIGRSAKEIKGTKDALLESIGTGDVYMSLYRRILNCRQEARKQKVREDDWEIQRRERERLFSEQKAIHDQLEAENLRRDQLLASAERWSKYCEVVTYVKAVEEAAGGARSPQVQAWLEWANRVLADSNPISVLLGVLDDSTPNAPAVGEGEEE